MASAPKKRSSRKGEGTITADAILKGTKARSAKANKFWVCAGVKRTGCGGGKGGGHVVSKKGRVPGDISGRFYRVR